jgi:molybdopterin/thiamine biosynthesis adenylyltransferase
VLSEANPLRVELDARDGRYDRQELITWWDQDRLASARVLVVGAGALGNELIKNLALLGIGTVLVIDLDAIENSNLSRCVLFREEDEGRFKAEVVAEAARALNPEVNVIPVVGDVRTSLGLQAFAAADVVLGGLDNREARLHVNQACWKTGTPWVDGAIEGLLGVARTFLPPDSACYECTLSEQDYKVLSARKACSLLERDDMLAGKVPTTATSASVVAGMQAQEAVKLLHRDRLDYGFAGRGFLFNGLTHDSYTVIYPRKTECMAHDTYELTNKLSRPAQTPFRALLEEAADRLAQPVVLEFEYDVVLTMSCAACDDDEVVRRPALSLTARDAVCPACGAERAVTACHSVTLDDSELLDLSAEDLHLPPNDVITARAGLDRIHFLLDSPRAAWGEFLADVG